MPLLRYYMGSSYCEAVRACLARDFGDAEPRAGYVDGKMALQLSYKKRVVDHLGDPLAHHDIVMFIIMATKSLEKIVMTTAP